METESYDFLTDQYPAYPSEHMPDLSTDEQQLSEKGYILVKYYGSMQFDSIADIDVGAIKKHGGDAEKVVVNDTIRIWRLP
jgi:hypothetical protein